MALSSVAALVFVVCLAIAIIAAIVSRIVDSRQRTFEARVLAAVQAHRARGGNDLGRYPLDMVTAAVLHEVRARECTDAAIAQAVAVIAARN